MWNGRALVRQLSAPIAQAFIEIHSSIVTAWGFGDLPPENFL